MKNVAEFREFVAQQMEDLVAGKIGVDVAGRIEKLAARVNESWHAEAKMMKIRAELNMPQWPTGGLPIGGNPPSEAMALDQ